MTQVTNYLKSLPYNEAGIYIQFVAMPTGQVICLRFKRGERLTDLIAYDEDGMHPVYEHMDPDAQKSWDAAVRAAGWKHPDPLWRTFPEADQAVLLREQAEEVRGSADEYAAEDLDAITDRDQLLAILGYDEEDVE